MTVKDARSHFRTAATLLLAVDVVALVVLVTPLAGTRNARLQELAEVRLRWQEQTRRTLPLRDIDKKLVEARAQVGAFSKDRLPARDSAVAEELGRVATQAGVRLTGVRYNSEAAEIEGVRRVRIDASLAADYLNVVKFINALERNRSFFLIDSLSLAEQQGGAVRLELRLESYVRDAGPS